jgi:hypothetical protein
LVLVLAALITALAYFETREETRKKTRKRVTSEAKEKYYSLVRGISGGFFLSLTIAIIWVLLTPPPTYFVVIDATAAMAAEFADVRAYMGRALTQVPRRAQVGLRVYGGESTSNSECSQSELLIPPSPASSIPTSIDPLLARIHPAGDASLTRAVLTAGTQDLTQVRGSKHLIVFTSGPNKECDNLASGTFESLAKLVDVDEAFIIGIGAVDDKSKLELTSYAKSLGGCYVQVDQATKLPQLDVIRSISYRVESASFFLECANENTIP